MKRGTHDISQEIGGVGTRGFVSVSDKSIGGAPVLFPVGMLNPKRKLQIPPYLQV
jgi:hypothetical protein